MGAIRPQAPDQGRDAPGPSLGETACQDIPNGHRLPRWGYESLRLLAQESRENPREKACFFLGIIPGLSPDALHPGWRPKDAGPEVQGRQARLFFPSSGGELFFPASGNIRRRGCRGSSPAAGPGAAEAPGSPDYSWRHLTGCQKTGIMHGDK